MNVIKAARAYRAAEQNYHAAFRDYFAGEITVLPEDRFWQLQSVLVREVATFRFGYGRSNGIEQAAGELFRKPLADDFNCWGDGDMPRYSMQEAIQFAKTWRELTRRLYQPLFDVVEDRGDDAYGDLLDSLPLAGHELVQRSLDRAFGNHRQFEQAVRDAGNKQPEMAELILHGENHVAMSLADAGRDYFSIAADDVSDPA